MRNKKNVLLASIFICMFTFAHADKSQAWESTDLRAIPSKPIPKKFYDKVAAYNQKKEELELQKIKDELDPETAELRIKEELRLQVREENRLAREKREREERAKTHPRPIVAALAENVIAHEGEELLDSTEPSIISLAEDFENQDSTVDRINTTKPISSTLTNELTALNNDAASTSAALTTIGDILVTQQAANQTISYLLSELQQGFQVDLATNTNVILGKINNVAAVADQSATILAGLHEGQTADSTWFGQGDYNALSPISYSETGTQNTVYGALAAGYNTTGSKNTVVGYGALANNTIGSNNTVIGASAVGGNSTHTHNQHNIIAIGAYAAYNNVGSEIIVTGSNAAYDNKANHLIAIGGSAAFTNTGTNVIAIGHRAAQNNSGFDVIAIGTQAARRNTGRGLISIGNTAGMWNTGADCIFTGSAAGYANTGSQVVATGTGAAFKNSGQGVVALGECAAYSNTQPNINAIGRNVLYNNTGEWCNAIGHENLMDNQGSRNNAFGHQALRYNTTGSCNNAMGSQALLNNTTGTYNNAMGYQAFHDNTTGNHNNAMGYQALYHNTSGYYNNAIGTEAFYSNTIGNYNNAIGGKALYNNTEGDSNNALGDQALCSNTSGTQNNALGANALYLNTVGSYNTALGAYTGYTAGVEPNGLTNGSYNTIIGYQAGNAYTFNESSNILIGHAGFNGESNQIHIGTNGTGDNQQNLCTIHPPVTMSNGLTVNGVATMTGGATISGGLTVNGGITSTSAVNSSIGNSNNTLNMYGSSIAMNGPVSFTNSVSLTNPIYLNNVPAANSGGDHVLVLEDGQIKYYTSNGLGAGTDLLASSIRYKHDISSLRTRNATEDQSLMDKILKINPSYFVYNEDLKLGDKRQIGVIAEELYELFPEFVALNKDGQPDKVNYAPMSALLVHAIQELNTQTEQVKTENQALKSTLVTVMDRLDKYDKLEAILNRIDVETLAELYDALNDEEVEGGVTAA